MLSEVGGCSSRFGFWKRRAMPTGRRRSRFLVDISLISGAIVSVNCSRNDTIGLLKDELSKAVSALDCGQENSALGWHLYLGSCELSTLQTLKEAGVNRHSQISAIYKNFEDDDEASSVSVTELLTSSPEG